MNSNVSFTGSFLIINPGNDEKKNILRDIMPESSFVKRNFLGKGMFVTVDDMYDREVAAYLMKEEHSFKYYPDINMHSGVCHFPVKLIEEMLKGAKEISARRQIKKHTAEAEKKYIPEGYIRTNGDHITQTINVLKTVEHIPANFLRHVTKNGETIFIDREGRTVAKASPNNPRGFNFIQTVPRYPSEDMEMIKADCKGEIHYRKKDIDNLRLFRRDYRAAVDSWNNN